MKHFALILLAALGCAGCAHLGRTPENYTAPSVDPVRASVSAASSTVQSVKGEIGAARQSIAKAQASANEIAFAVSADLRPVVEELQFRISQADVQLREADAKAQAALAQLAESQKQTETLKVMIDRQTSELNQQAREKNQALDLRDKAETRAKEQEALAWKWRLRAFFAVIGCILSVLCIFRRPLGALFGWPIP